MNRSIRTILLFVTGIGLIYSVFITKPEGILKIFSWAYLSILALCGWELMFYILPNSKFTKRSKEE